MTIHHFLHNYRSTIICCSLALFFHGYIIYSIAQQPLPVNFQPASERAVIWSWHNDTIHRGGPAADFFSLYHAGHQLQQGLSPYAPTEEPRFTPYFSNFRYLPIIAQTLGVLSVQFDPQTAYWLWIGLLELCLGLLIVLIYLTKTPRLFRNFATCLLLVNSPYFLEVHMGQFTFITLALLGIGLLLWERQLPVQSLVRPSAFTGSKDGRKGNVQKTDNSAVPRRQNMVLWVMGALSVLSYTGAVVIKTFPLVTGAAFLKQRRYWWHVVIPIPLIVLVSLPYFLSHPLDWTAFYQANFSRPLGGMDAGNHGLVYLIALTISYLEIRWWLEIFYPFASAFHWGMIGLTAFLVLFSRHPSVVLGAATLILAHFVSYIHVWEHHMSGVILMGLLVLWDVLCRSHPSKILIVGCVLALLMLALPTPYAWFDTAQDVQVWDPSPDWPLYARYLNPLCKVIPTVLLYGIGIGLLLKSGLGWPWSSSKNPFH